MTQAAKIALKTAGTNGNGFALLGVALRAAKQTGWTPEQLEAFKREATKGGYDALLRALQDHFEME